MPEDVKKAEVVEPVKETCLAKIEETGLEKSKGQTLLENFSGFFMIASDWEKKAKAIVITNVEQKAEMKMAREGRLFLKKKRGEVEKKRKELKENITREGKAIDGIANVLKATIVPIEEYLDSQEKYADRLEAEKKEALKKERMTLLLPYGVDVSVYSDFGEMEDATFQNILEMSKKAFEERQEEARKKEAERVAKEKADAEERERIRLENEKLKKEAEEREKQAEIEREKQEEKLAEEKAKAEAEKKAIEEKARIEREEQEAEAKKKEEEAQKKLDAERKEREKAEAELKAKEEAEEKAKQEREAKEKAKKDAEAKLKMAPDKDKLGVLSKAILKFNYPAVETDEGIDIISKVKNKFAGIAEFIDEEAEKL